MLYWIPVKNSQNTYRALLFILCELTKRINQWNRVHRFVQPAADWHYKVVLVILLYGKKTRLKSTLHEDITLYRMRITVNKNTPNIRGILLFTTW